MTSATATGTSLTATHLQMLRFSRGATKKMLEGISAARACEQPTNCMNHALWTLGHLASTDDFMLVEFTGQKSALPESWNTLFGMGSTPTSDASKYPSMAEVSKALDERRAVLEKWVASLTPAHMATQTPEGWRPYTPTLGDVPGFIAWHEGYHQGQLAVLRRGLGLGRAFG